jgi:hypothetical protein
VNCWLRQKGGSLDIGEVERSLLDCRKWLADQLEEEDIADDVWGYLIKGGLPFDVILHKDAESRQQLVAEAKAYVKKPRGDSSGFEPGRSDVSLTLSEIAVKPPKNALRRAEGFAEIAALLADKHPEVRRFRRMHVLPERDRLLTDEEAPHDQFLSDEEARGFLERWCGGPLPVRRGPKAVAVRLWKLAEKLSNIYLWREGDAVWFVLTGHAPSVRPIEVRAVITPPQDKALARIPSEYHPNTARITVTADAWVNVKDVSRAFREGQQQILAGGDAAGPTPERTLEVIRFVARRERKCGEEDWETRWRAWNESCPESWRYLNENNFKQTFERFVQGVVYRTYQLPNYRLPERTPYRAYRDDWTKRYEGTADPEDR